MGYLVFDYCVRAIRPIDYVSQWIQKHLGDIFGAAQVTILGRFHMANKKVVKGGHIAGVFGHLGVQRKHGPEERARACPKGPEFNYNVLE